MNMGAMFPWAKCLHFGSSEPVITVIKRKQPSFRILPHLFSSDVWIYSNSVREGCHQRRTKDGNQWREGCRGPATCRGGFWFCSGDKGGVCLPWSSAYGERSQWFWLDETGVDGCGFGGIFRALSGGRSNQCSDCSPYLGYWPWGWGWAHGDREGEVRWWLDDCRSCSPHRDWHGGEPFAGTDILGCQQLEWRQCYRELGKFLAMKAFLTNTPQVVMEILVLVHHHLGRVGQEGLHRQELPQLPVALAPLSRGLGSAQVVAWICSPFSLPLWERISSSNSLCPSEFLVGASDASASDSGEAYVGETTPREEPGLVVPLPGERRSTSLGLQGPEAQASNCCFGNAGYAFPHDVPLQEELVPQGTGFVTPG